jgi:hypothetical protein
MLKPSKRHFLIYDAQTFEESGFIKVAGNVSQMAQKPQFWQISVTPKTTDGTQIDKTNLKFTSDKRMKLGELAPVINEHIFALDDFLPKCISVIVVARVMTDGGR